MELLCENAALLVIEYKISRLDLSYGNIDKALRSRCNVLVWVLAYILIGASALYGGISLKNSLTKKLLSVILAVAVIFGALPVFAVPSFAAGVSDLTFELNDNGGGYTVSGCNSSASGEIVIPSEYNELPVTSIGYWAFEDCTSLISITIPDSVTSIGYCAFRDCTSLTSVTIPDSVTSIGGSAFYGCTSLISVTIPDSVTSIDNWAFEDCTSLISVTIGDSVTS